jgi:peptide/nickel transport system substrate-binding protein
MKRLSSATGCNKGDLNNTLVFHPQDGVPVPLRQLAIGVIIIASAFACRRTPPAKTNEAPGNASSSASRTLPQRALPVPPPLIPTPESLPRTRPGRKTGNVKIHLENEPINLNPFADPDAATLQVIADLIYEPLLDCPSPGAPGDYRPVLAESWQLSPDGLRLSLRLRSGVKWHDGHALNALDVQATLEPLLLSNRTNVPVLRASLQDIAAIEVMPDRVVRLVLKRPSASALRALCDVPILPEHLLRGPTGDQAALAKQPVGTGPFRLAAWERGKRIRLARSSTYWATPAALDEITFEIDLDGARALVRTRRGDIDILPRVMAAHYPDDVDPVTLHGAMSLWRMQPDRWAYVAVNHKKQPLGDPQFRQALAALWNREHFARDLHQGLAHALPGPLFAKGAPPARGRDWAIAALEAAGYRDTNTDGVRDQAEKPIRLSLVIAAGARTAATEAHAFVLEARKSGILIDLTTVDAPALLGRVRKGDFDLALMVWDGSPGEDPGLMFGSSGAFNFFGYRSAEVDATLDSLRQTTATSERTVLLDRLGDTLTHDQPVLFLYRFDQPTLVAGRVHDLAAIGARLDLRQVWVDP